jgi:hypothetical protein
MSWPYCQEPECHNSHTQSYTDIYANRAAGDTRPWLPDGHRITMDGVERPGWRRWCRAHALMNEGVAFG